MTRILAYLLAALPIIFLITTFVIRNGHTVQLEYYFNLNWSAPLALILLVFAIAGIFVGILLTMRKVIQLQARLALTRRELRISEEELAELKRQQAGN